MRIVSVSTTYPAGAVDPGARTFVHDLNVGLARRGHEVVALVPHGPGSAEREDLDGVQVRRFRYAPEALETVFGGAGALPALRTSWTARAVLPAALLALEVAVLRTARQVRPDLLHVHWLVPQGLLALPVARLLHVPLVVTAHGSDVHGLPAALDPWVRRVIERAHLVTANSTYTGDRILELGVPRRLELAPMGLDLSLFSPRRAPREPDLVLGVGRLDARKGFDVLLRASAIVMESRAIRVVILGEGPERVALAAQARRLGVPLELPGGVERGDVATWLGRAAILASASRAEGLGLALLEGLAAGTPVVATAVGGVPAAVGDAGLLVPPEDAEGLAGAMRSVLAGGPEVARRVATGLERARAFDQDRVVARFEDLLLSVTRAAGGASA